MFLKADQLCGGYGKNRVIQNVSLEVSKGDFLGIIGPNGSGKSTLLKLLTRVLALEEGSIFLDGQNIDQIGLKSLCKKIAFVPQETLVQFPFTVYEIVLMGRIPYLNRWQTETKQDFLIVENALKVTDCFSLRHRQIDELSFGERQRVITAKALAQQPELLLLDEPTSHLDIGHQIQMLNLLKTLNQDKKLTLIMVLHDLNLASEYCNKILLLHEGKVYKEGSSEDVLTYQNIEAVYKTVVVVRKNPISLKPYVVLVSKTGNVR